MARSATTTSIGLKLDADRFLKRLNDDADRGQLCISSALSEVARHP
jgi:hypothetical protein